MLRFLDVTARHFSSPGNGYINSFLATNPKTWFHPTQP